MRTWNIIHQDFIIIIIIIIITTIQNRTYKLNKVMLNQLNLAIAYYGIYI